MPNSLSNAVLSSSLAPKTIYGYVIGLLLTLLGIKYEGPETNPFKEHGPIMLLFLITMLVYVIALTHWKCRADNVDNSPILSFCLCHVSGALSSELLVLILIPPIWWFVVNLSLALVVLVLFFYYHESFLGLGAVGQEDTGVEMV